MAETTTITKVMTAILVGSLVILVFSNFTGNLASKYGHTLTEEESEFSVIEKMNETYTKTQSYQNSTSGGSITFGANAGINLVDFYLIVRQFFDVFDITQTMATQSLAYIGVPVWFSNMILGIIIITILGIVIAIFMGREKV